jgi:hypothetical protein
MSKELNKHIAQKIDAYEHSSNWKDNQKRDYKTMLKFMCGGNIRKDSLLYKITECRNINEYIEKYNFNENIVD